MICSNCGKEIARGAVFCSSCGTKAPEVEVPVETPVPVEKAVENTAAEPVPVPTPTPVPVPTPVPMAAPVPAPAEARVNNGFSGQVPPPPPMPVGNNVMRSKEEKPKTFFGKGALAVCLVIIGILSCSTTVFATLFFTLLGRI